MNSNEVRIVSDILQHLHKRLSILRESLCGEDQEKLTKIFSSCNYRDVDDHSFYSKIEELRSSIECVDIENEIEKVLQGLKETKETDTIKEVLNGYETREYLFEKRVQSLEMKKTEIEELKKALRNIKERGCDQPQESKNCNTPKVPLVDSPTKLSSYVRVIMNSRLESKKEFYNYLLQESRDKVKWYERESKVQSHADIQNISFWLHKYQVNSVELDRLLRQTYDNWTTKEKENAILMKYRRLNQKKMENVSKEIAVRQEVINADQVEKELEQQKRLEKEKRTQAAIRIQSFWRGTMVRKHLGPYKKKKKKKKGKGKKKKK